MLRDRIHDLDRPANAVEMRNLDSFDAFAPAPASAITVLTLADRPAAAISLMGVFALCFPLEEDATGIDLAFVSDPTAPDRSCVGPMMEVIAKRQGVI